MCRRSTLATPINRNDKIQYRDRVEPHSRAEATGNRPADRDGNILPTLHKTSANTTLPTGSHSAIQSADPPAAADVAAAANRKPARSRGAPPHHGRSTRRPVLLN